MKLEKTIKQDHKWHLLLGIVCLIEAAVSIFSLGRYSTDVRADFLFPDDGKDIESLKGLYKLLTK